MTNYFAGKTVEWLLARRDVLQDAMASGAGTLTHVSLSPGMYDEFAGMKQSELDEQLRRILYSLYVLDPDNYDDPNASKRMRVYTVYR